MEFQQLLSTAGSLASEGVAIAPAFRRKLQKLYEMFAVITAVVQDAGERQITSPAIGYWLMHIKNAGYDAEDVMDEFNYEILERNVEIQNQLKKKVRKFFSLSNPILFRMNMNKKLDKIYESLKELSEYASGFGLQVASVEQAPLISLHRDTYPYLLVEESIFGRESDVSKVINLLIRSSNQQHLPVVPIAGMAGVGKTTLAQLMYKVVRERQLFDEIIWVCVADHFDASTILQEMLSALSRNMVRISERSAILEGLKKELRGKSFLLVLDDVWNGDPEKWDSLRGLLLKICGDTASAVIVTTRSRMVASITETSPECRLELNRLSDDLCWSIIKELACRHRAGAELPLELEVIGKDIAKKCGGLPLAARAIGSVLSSSLSVTEWVSIRDGNVWDAEEQVLTILKLSYDHLPPLVKQCFRYCSVFPRGFNIEREQLIQLWMAEGFFGASGERMEAAGRDCFRYLVQIFFFEELKTDEYGGIKSCKMNSLVHDLAMYVSKETMILETYSDVHAVSHIRYVYLSYEGENELTISNYGAAKWRSLFSRADVINGSWNFKSLRTLTLDGADIKELQGSILSKLKHLRYLDLSRTGINALPESITSLYNLQTLRLIECRSLQTLPRKMTNLVSLRHIYFTYHHQMPAEVGHLTSLQTLPFFVVDPDNGQTIQELESLNELRGKLLLYNLERVKDKKDAEKANLHGKGEIYAVEFAWSSARQSFDSDEDVLEGLQPHPNIKSLKIENYGGKNFPSWLLMKIPSHGDSSTLNNLVNLKLMHCKVIEKLPMLGHLPQLKVLDIMGAHSVRCIGNEFYISEGENGKETMPRFPALEKLCLQCMDNLVEWMVPAVGGGSGTPVFPCLQELHVKRCPQLLSIPISHMPSLLSLEIILCSELSNLSGEFLASTHLEDLKVESCPNLESIPSLQSMASLKRFSIQRCHKLTSLPTGLQSCTSLERLSIQWCTELTSIPDEMLELKSLLHLEITKCPSLTYFPEDSLCYSTQLKQLTVGPFPEELEAFPGLNSIQHLSSLEKVVIYGWDKLKSLPDQLRHLTGLKLLDIRRFNRVKALPEWLGSLSSLQQLTIWRCRDMKYLPHGFHNLQKLDIIDCGLLEQNYAQESGPEWSKISHVPEISFSNGKQLK